jgi:carboxyl-terminal processing protease
MTSKAVLTMQRVLKAALVAALVLTLTAGAFVGGALFERMRSPLLPGTDGSALQALVGEVQGVIKADALRPSAEASQTKGAIEGLLASLEDTYAAYFDPSANKEFQMDAKGEFFGVGMTVGMEENTPTIGMVFKDSPAQKAGIKAGDHIVAVDGVRKTWTLDEVVGRIRGPAGTKVTIEMARDDVVKPLSFTITRARITIPNIMSEMVGKDVGHLRLMGFNERTAEDLRTEIKALDAKGARGFVLDLRGNPGGLLSSAIAVTSLFVESGVVVRVDERGQPETEEMALGGVATTKPLTVLIDGNSASASEIVAGALQDYKRATVIGEKSYGKGSVQVIRELSNGGAVKLTNAHYLTPKGRIIDGKGVVPDIALKMDPKLAAEQSTDTQLKKAAEVVRAAF